MVTAFQEECFIVQEIYLNCIICWFTLFKFKLRMVSVITLARNELERNGLYQSKCLEGPQILSKNRVLSI